MDRRQDHRGQRTRPDTANTSNQPRQNEYFVPRDGIDREVITADICRYLGNDALVRPGNYTDQDNRIIQGYYITAYRNLTTNMIQDLQADSARWEQERRRAQTTAGGRDQPRYGGGGGYGSRHEQAPTLRYPGNDAPGYSSGQQPAGAASGSHYRDPGYAEPSTYGQSAQWSSQAAGMPAAYATGQDRPGGVPFSQHPTGPGVMGQAERPWEAVGANLGVARGALPAHPTLSGGMDVDDAHYYAPTPGQGTYPGSGTQAPSSRQPQAQYPAGYGGPQNSSAAFSHAQPVDAFYGRTGGAAAPVGAYAQAKNSPGPYGDDMVMGGTTRAQERGPERRVKREYEEPPRERNRHRDDERPRDRDRDRDRNSKTTYGRR